MKSADVKRVMHLQFEFIKIYITIHKGALESVFLRHYCQFISQAFEYYEYP